MLRATSSPPAVMQSLPLALLLILSLVSVAGCRSSRQALTSGAGGPAGRPEDRAVRLIVSEYHETYSLLLSLTPDNPLERRTLARIDHAPNWPPRAVVGAGGDVVAYTVLSSDGRIPETEGSLWTIALGQKEPRKLAARVDARTPPVLAADGSRVAVHRFARVAGGEARFTLEDIEVSSGKTVVVADEPAAVRLFPVGYVGGASRFLYVRFENDGAHLIEVALADRTVRDVGRLADGAARDFRLSRSGDRLLYLAATGTPPRFRAYTAHIATGVVQPLLPDWTRTDDVGVAWRVTDRAVATIGTIDEHGEPVGEVVAGADGIVLARRATGFDAPVAWSPDGRFLFARSFSGRSADNPGSEQPVLIDAEGRRVTIPVERPIAFVGWSGDAP